MAAARHGSWQRISGGWTSWSILVNSASAVLLQDLGGRTIAHRHAIAGRGPAANILLAVSTG